MLYWYIIPQKQANDVCGGTTVSHPATAGPFDDSMFSVTESTAPVTEGIIPRFYTHGLGRGHPAISFYHTIRIDIPTIF